MSQRAPKARNVRVCGLIGKAWALKTCERIHNNYLRSATVLVHCIFKEPHGAATLETAHL